MGKEKAERGVGGWVWWAVAGTASGTKSVVVFLARLLYLIVGLMLFGCVLWTAHYWGASGTPDSVGGFVLGALFCLWVFGMWKIK
jgi:hypothetical protein